MNQYNSIAIAIKSASLNFDKLANQLLSTVGLTPAQFRVLKILLKSPPTSVRQVDIERIFNMSNPTVTGLVKTLEKENFIERVSHPNDNRSKVLKLTQKTEAMRETLVAMGEQLEAQFTACLSEEEKAVLLPLLIKLSESTN